MLLYLQGLRFIKHHPITANADLTYLAMSERKPINVQYASNT